MNLNDTYGNVETLHWNLFQVVSFQSCIHNMVLKIVQLTFALNAVMIAASKISDEIIWTKQKTIRSNETRVSSFP